MHNGLTVQTITRIGMLYRCNPNFRLFKSHELGIEPITVMFRQLLACYCMLTVIRFTISSAEVSSDMSV